MHGGNRRPYGSSAVDVIPWRTLPAKRKVFLGLLPERIQGNVCRVRIRRQKLPGIFEGNLGVLPGLDWKLVLRSSGECRSRGKMFEEMPKAGECKLSIPKAHRRSELLYRLISEVLRRRETAREAVPDENENRASEKVDVQPGGLSVIACGDPAGDGFYPGIFHVQIVTDMRVNGVACVGKQFFFPHHVEKGLNDIDFIAVECGRDVWTRVLGEFSATTEMTVGGVFGKIACGLAVGAAFFRSIAGNRGGADRFAVGIDD